MAADGSRRGGTLRWAARVAVSLAIVVYILVDVDTGDLVHTIRNVRLAPFAVAFGLYVAGQMMSAYKWSLLGRAVGFAQPLATYARFYFIGMFFNLFFPSTVGGDVARGLYLGAGRHPVLAVNSVVFDRLSGLAVLMAIGALALVAFPDHDLPWPLVASVVGAGVVLIAGWWLCPRLVRFLPADNRIRRQVEVDLEPFWRDSRLLARVVTVSSVFHLVQVLTTWVLARAAGASVPFTYCIVAHAVISVMTALPVSIAGIGVREGGYIYFLTRIHVDDSIAVTVGLLWFALTVLGGLIGAGLFVGSGATLPQLRARAIPAVPTA